MRAMVDSYLSELEYPPDTRFLEIGSGSGAVTRTVACRPGVAEAVGVDPSPVFVSKAQALARTIANIAFEQGDGRALRFGDDEFDVVVLHTTLCHVPEPERVLAEAFRVLRTGWLAGRVRR